MSPSKVESSKKRGWIVPVGGAEDKLGSRDILRRFVEIAGADQAHIVIIPTASVLAETGSKYETLFTELGASSAEALPIATREDCQREKWLRTLEKATGIFLTGGNQLRLSTTLGGTPIAKAIRQLNARGVAVGGTSAGAAVLSEHMIAAGDEGSLPKAGMASLVPGFGMTNRVIIDQHFRQRDRLGRLLSALSYNPFAIGLGLDEDTAACIDCDDKIHVVGAGAITIVDVSNLGFSSAANANAGEPLCMTNVKLHLLTGGSTFDMQKREATPPRDQT
jgi:cyanophycinase